MAYSTKKFNVLDILASGYEYCARNFQPISLFMLGHMVFLFIFEAIDKWRSPVFIPWVALYYVYNVFFYRFYFKKKPYFELKSTGKSLIPSTKIIFITVLLLFLLLVLPFMVIPFFTPDPELLDQYLNILDAGIDKSKTFDLLTNIIMIFISPFILYRPFLAWIASLLGRSPLLKTAFQKTRGNYWNFVCLSFIMNLPYMMFSQAEFYFDINNYLAWFLAAILITYFNVIMCKCYDLFYLDNED